MQKAQSNVSLTGITVFNTLCGNVLEVNSGLKFGTGTGVSLALTSGLSFGTGAGVSLGLTSGLSVGAEVSGARLESTSGLAFVTGAGVSLGLTSGIAFITGAGESLGLTSGFSAADTISGMSLYSSSGLTFVDGSGASLYLSSGAVMSGLSFQAGSGTSLVITSALVAKSFTITGLTAGRIPYVTTSGTITDSSNLTFVTASNKVGIGAGAGNAGVQLNGAAGGVRYFDFMTASGLRWRTQGTTTAEGGSDAGTDYTLTAYKDDGATTIDTPITILRVSGGTMSLTRPLAVASSISGAGLTSSSGLTFVNGTGSALNLTSGLVFVTGSGVTLNTTSGITALADSTFNGIRVGRGIGSDTTNLFVGEYGGVPSASGVTQSTFIGDNVAPSVTAPTGLTAVGRSTLYGVTSGSNHTGVGRAAGSVLTTGSGVTCLGALTDVTSGGISYSLVAGCYSVASGDNMFVAGCSGAYLGDVYIGKGYSNAAPSGVTYHATGGNGTSISGGYLNFEGGRPTGSGASGPITFLTASGGASGTTVRTGVVRLTIDTGVYTPNVWLTPDGGVACKFVAGEAITSGYVISAKQTGVTGFVYKVTLTGNDNDMPIGVAVTTAASGADIWCTVAGIAYVIPESGATATMGYHMSTTQTGSAGTVAVNAAVPVAALHFKEVGHYLDTATGAGLAARAIIHFN